MLRLVISDNEGTTTVVPLVRDEISIGRKEGNTIRLTERNVSRHHARLHRENGAYRVQDLDSYNGTLVNGARVQGERDVGPGDRIEIGDYAILVEAEVEARAGTPAEPPGAESKGFDDDPTQVAAKPPAPAVARLVVLAGPGAGSEHPLPASGKARLGRAEDAEISIDHRSVSREHVELAVDDGCVRIRDLGSSNGMRIDGAVEREAALGGGEVIELGEVLLRYVAPGERYVYDPADAAPYLSRHRDRGKSSLLLAGGIVGVALLVTILILTSGDEAPEAIASSPAQAEQAPEVVETEAVEVEPAAPEDDPYPEALAHCRSALEGGRFAEAMAHAALALRARGGDADAETCQRDAQAGLEQEQAFVRAREALESGDLGVAQRELSSIAPDSPLLAKPEVAGAMEQLARRRLEQARARLADAPGISAKLAQDVLDLGGVPESQRAQASQVLAKARAAPKPRAVAAAKKRPKKRGSRAAGGSRKSPMEVANACLAKGDNPCVVRALAGRARTAQELGLLIETYRAMGKTRLAYKHMTQYVKRFPGARRAGAYQRMLERQ